MHIRQLFYIGSMQTPEDCARNPWGSEAMNRTQLELMRAFCACGVESVVGLSFPGTSAWHSAPRLRRGKHSNLEDGVEVRELPFLALGPLQVLSQSISCTWSLVRTSPRSRPDAILITNPLARTSIPTIRISRAWNIPVAILATDLTPAIATKNVFRYAQRWLEREVARSAPGIVVFSNHLGRDLRPNRSWVRIVRPPDSDLLRIPVSHPDPATRIVYHAGTLAEVSGTDLVIQSVRYFSDPTYRFWFSGRGPLDEAIREAARQDPRITHWGFVNREKYIQLLQRANVLVNPRPTRLPENRYNFPSKLMDFMAAGRPVVSTATSDISEHYLDAIVLLENETPEGLAHLIQEICHLPLEEQIFLGRRARAHVEGETWETQAQRILDFMGSLQQ